MLITKRNFASLFDIAFRQSSNSNVIKKAFNCCGLYPFNPNSVDYTKCMANRFKNYGNNCENESSNSLHNEELISLNKNILISLESSIPDNILKDFLDSYNAGLEPDNEKILFRYLKTQKDQLHLSTVSSPNNESVLFFEVPSHPIEISCIDLSNESSTNETLADIPIDVDTKEI